MSTTKVTYLSKKGMKELKKEISRLERDKQAALVRLHELDKTDNHEEQLARAEVLATIEVLESELSDKQLVLKAAMPLPRKRDALKVAIGSVVDLIDTNGRVIRYTIVDSIEANPSDGRISISSPLGQSLLGKQIQDIVEWTARIGTKQLKLVGIG
jgi:transcription elongation factor GreA